MKLSQFTKPLLATAVALSVGTLSLSPASAQTGTTDTAPGTAAPNTTITDPITPDTTTDNNDDGFDWGWLGLFGLIGLAGLRKQHDDREVYRDPSVDPSRTATRTTDYNR